MSRACLRISMDLLRELLDLPDGIEIRAALVGERPGGDSVLTLLVSSPHEMHDGDVTPVYRRIYDEGIPRVELQEIAGYQGPLEPRPSTRRGR